LVTSHIKAEENEKQSLLQLQKVLFVYLNYPAQYNEAWFKTDSVSKKPETVVQKTETKPEVKPVAKVTTDVQSIDKPKTEIKKDEIKAPTAQTKKDSSIYSMVGVDESQIDIFNNFLQKQYPKDYEKYIIDFATMDYSDLQSLRNIWYKYKFGVLEDSTQYYAAHNEVANPKDTVQHLAQLNKKETGKSQTAEKSTTDTKSTLSSSKSIQSQKNTELLELPVKPM
jgi:hypothetical protein